MKGVCNEVCSVKVAVSVGGKFHAFYLAEQLQKRDMLGQLITSYPRCEVVKSGIRPELVSTVIVKELLERGHRKLPWLLRESYNPQFAISDLYDRLAARRFRQCDLFVGWSGFSLHTMQQAKRMGGATIVERGSAHIEYQRDILAEEYSKYGLRQQLPHPRIVEKELSEYALADYISVPSLFAKRTFLEKGFPEQKIIHVPYGVDISQFRPMQREDDLFRVIFCGGASLQKGCHYLLQAFHELRLKNAELWLVGNVTPEMKPFVEKYRSANIIFHGQRPQRELPWYYSQASVFCLLSIQDGFGMVIPQAMACQLPVICSSNTAGEDIVRDGVDGFVIPIRDLNALKKKILFFYENPHARREMGESARQRVLSGFSWDDYGETVCSSYAQIYSKAVGA
jgi:glycosyltransferase involved in cell wall biosynthesis